MHNLTPARTSEVSAQIAEHLRSMDFFKQFSSAEIVAFSRHFELRACDQEEVIFYEGDAGNFMLMVVDGQLAILKSGDFGPHLLTHVAHGSIVGEITLLDEKPRSATCVADTDCKLLTLSRASLDQLAEKHPLVAYHLVLALAKIVTERLRKTSDELAEYFTL